MPRLTLLLLRDVGHTKSCSRPVLILQPVGRLIPYCTEHDALFTLIKQYACIVQQLSIRGHLHGELSYYNLLQHVHSEGQHQHDQGTHALLVDMQTLMPVRQVTCSLLLILQEHIQQFVLQGFVQHVSVVVRAAQAECTVGTPLFVGLNVIRKQGHCVSTELETLMVGGILCWRHLDINDYNLGSIRCGVMTSTSEFC